MPAPSPRRLRLLPEWGCWPLWDAETGDNLAPEDVALPAALIARINAWDDSFQAILDQNYPPDSDFPSPEAAEAYQRESAAIAQELEHLLGTNFVNRLWWKSGC